MSAAVGEIVEGIVTGITGFGAFIQLPNGQTGLVHISEVADAFVHDVRDHLKQGDQVKVKILSVNENGSKIALSIKQAQEGYVPGRSSRRRVMSNSFEDKLGRFMKESEERQSDLRRKANAKRGRGGRV